jgi:glutamyl-tRNA synthetase
MLELASRLERLEPYEWNLTMLEAVVRGYAEELGLSAGKLIHPIRLSITGKRVGAGMFETMTVLGRELSLERLRSYAESKQEVS